MEKTQHKNTDCALSEDKSKNKKMGRRQALIKLGLAATTLYLAPALMSLNQAAASGGGGGSGGGGFFGGGERGGRGGGGSGAGALMVGDPTTEKECGECHEPYAAQNLPAGSWQKIMNNLSNHFGEDASIDDATRQKITNFLVSNAGGRGNGPLRITETSWFRSKHRGRYRSGAGSMSSCKSCHSPNYRNFNNRRNRRW